ncbi:MAG: pilin [Candidatus Magasanikbacteria bacterium]|nr:pilin [Candidatus Magasanikbacteria bacterium]
MNKLIVKLIEKKAVVAMIVVFAFSFAMAPVVFAQDTFGLEEVETGLAGSLGSESIQTTIASVINIALSLLGVVAVVIILMGGFKWMTAGGSEEKVGEAKKIIFSGIIGLAIIMSAWALATFVIAQLSTATGSNADVSGYL